MQSHTLFSFLFVFELCVAQRVIEYTQFEGNRSSPRNVSPEVQDALEQADINPDASHTVRFSAPGHGDWDWTLQVSDVSVARISNSTPNAHVAFTTWHFSRPDEEAKLFKRSEDSPPCAYLMDINFPYNVSSQWDPNDSSCVPALGERCANALGSVRMTDKCDSRNAILHSPSQREACAGMLTGGPAESDGITTQGYAFNARNLSDGAWAYALTSPYEGNNETAFQAAAERLRIMLFSGPGGSELVCNRVAQTVKIGAEEDESEGGNESGASSYSSHVGGLVISSVVCCLAAYWL